ncbi:hypothetical protein Y032_0048g1558 [Ancylostoma ceylanicum]|uniref:Uncharacterized protein n=1 Tax=Ancylostoma ceylanicum TaxID=53326 RepID=A0A016UB08_9BILA|nr:hypothetical protein Y032_0048g1558 [Ancylostoma ceylanicum]
MAASSIHAKKKRKDDFAAEIHKEKYFDLRTRREGNAFRPHLLCRFEDVFQLMFFFFRIPGCSTLSLHRKSPSSIFVASPYNTLRATSVAR